MKHKAFMNRSDHADLKKALSLIEEGRKIKRRVLSRIRMRVLRSKPG